jgi:hypothetical protein
MNNIFIPRCSSGKSAFLLLSIALILQATVALATSNHQYGADEYATITKGISPDGKYAITAHGGGEYGYDHFHIYLTNAITGKKIGPLEEIVQTLDTGADAFCAKWSDDSRQTVIVYRISRHEPLKAVFYHFAKGRAFLIKGPVDATDEQSAYWRDQCSQSHPSEKVFGHPAKGIS